MSTNRHIDRVCAVGIICALLLMILFINGEALGIQPASRVLGYETRLFDTSRVHTLEIIIDDWEDFLNNCTGEEYSPCTVLIDNEAYKNIAIRGKGNTSLSTVARMDSQRYSFKIEFDHYENGGSYYGLDKLSLNNIIQDNTYMKDYLAYRLMDEFGADAPLCSYVWITVNGEDWGLYLAVEGVEDSFLQRNYGANHGNLYKPDSQSFGGGGPGNGRNFDFNNFSGFPGGNNSINNSPDNLQNFPGFPDGQTPDNFPGFPGFPDGETPDNFPGFPGEQSGEEFDGEFNADSENENPNAGEEFDGESDAQSGRRRFSFSGAFGGMGSSDVKLRYIDDNPESYSNIFNNAKTDMNNADKTRLIASLKSLSECENLDNILNIDEIIRYFVVHNYICNGDSYTGSIIHNYYLYEQDGQLSMIPWDYNLAFGTFQSSDASAMINDPIDTPMSVSDASDRPMFGWIMNQEEYLNLYHEYFAEFLENIDIISIINAAYENIAPYVERDPTAFCEPEDFETAVKVLREFCALRSESVQGQLSGVIPSTKTGQSENSENLIDASGITLSDMGNMGHDGGGPGGDNGGNPGGNRGELGQPNFAPGAGNSNGRGGMNRGGENTNTNGAEANEFNRENAADMEISEANSGENAGENINGDINENINDMERQRPDFMGMERMERPDGFPGEFPGMEQQSVTIGADTWILLGISVIILFAGMIIALKTRHRS